MDVPEEQSYMQPCRRGYIWQSTETMNMAFMHILSNQFILGVMGSIMGWKATVWMVKWTPSPIPVSSISAVMLMEKGGETDFVPSA